MPPQAIVYIVIVTASQLIYWAQGNKGMSQYLFLLACGTLLQYYWRVEIVSPVVVSIVEVRLLATVFGIISKRYRHNDEFIRSLKYIFGATLVRIFLVNSDVIGTINLYLSFKIAVLLYIILYFKLYDPIRFHLKSGWGALRRPYLSRRWRMKDSLLAVIGIYVIDFIGFYGYYGSGIREHWMFHQISSIVFAGTLLVIGVVYWVKQEQMDWNAN